MVVRHGNRQLNLLLLKCCFTSTETVGLFGTGAQDVHLDFHTTPELCATQMISGVCFITTHVPYASRTNNYNNNHLNRDGTLFLPGADAPHVYLRYVASTAL